jgi:hypothetical protein
MSEDINFLPKELRPQKKSAPKKDDGVLLSEPQRERRPSVEKKSAPAGRHWWQDIISPAPDKLRDDRKNLLTHIQSGTAEPVRETETKAPKSLSEVQPASRPPKPRRPSIVSRLRSWLARPQSSKETTTERKVSGTSPRESFGNLSRQSTPAPSHFHQQFVGTNLIEGQEFLFFNWRKSASINIISIIVTLFLVAGAWWYALQVKQSQGVYTSPLKTQLEQAQDKLSVLTEQVEALAPLRRRAQLIQALLDKHIYWTNFFTYLEDNTLSGVYYLGFEGDLLGEYGLKGRAPDFAAFVAQAQTWQQETRYTKAATIQSMQTVSAQQLRGDVSQQINVNEFELGLSVDTAIFYK